MTENKKIAVCMSQGVHGELELLLEEELAGVRIITIPERIRHNGELVHALDLESTFVQLNETRQQGFIKAYICLLHSCHFPQHEKQVAEMAAAIGFEEAFVSFNYAGNSWQRLAAMLGKEITINDSESVWCAEPEWIECSYPLLLKTSKVVGQRIERHFRALQDTSLEASFCEGAEQVMLLNSAGVLTEITVAEGVSIRDGETILLLGSI